MTFHLLTYFSWFLAFPCFFLVCSIRFIFSFHAITHNFIYSLYLWIPWGKTIYSGGKFDVNSLIGNTLTENKWTLNSLTVYGGHWLLAMEQLSLQLLLKGNWTLDGSAVPWPGVSLFHLKINRLNVKNGHRTRDLLTLDIRSKGPSLPVKKNMV